MYHLDTDPLLREFLILSIAENLYLISAMGIVEGSVSTPK